MPDWIARANVDWKRINAPHGQRAPIANLRKLLHEDDQFNANTRSDFEAWAVGKIRDPHFEADTRIAALMISGFIDDPRCLELYFDGLTREAEAASLAKLYSHAAWIYIGLIKSLGVHFNRIDDSYGKFWPLFEECTEKLGECVIQSEISDGERRDIIWNLACYSMASFVEFMEYYEKVLTKLCTSAADLGVWRDALESKLESGTAEESPHRSDTIHKGGTESILERVLMMIKEMEGRTQSKTKCCPSLPSTRLHLCHHKDSTVRTRSSDLDR